MFHIAVKTNDRCGAWLFKRNANLLVARSNPMKDIFIVGQFFTHTNMHAHVHAHVRASINKHTEAR